MLDLEEDEIGELEVWGTQGGSGEFKQAACSEDIVEHAGGDDMGVDLAELVQVWAGL